jgi:hypothetical protein
MCFIRLCRLFVDVGLDRWLCRRIVGISLERWLCMCCSFGTGGRSNLRSGSGRQACMVRSREGTRWRWWREGLSNGELIEESSDRSTRPGGDFVHETPNISKIGETIELDHRVRPERYTRR